MIWNTNLNNTSNNYYLIASHYYLPNYLRERFINKAVLYSMVNSLTKGRWEWWWMLCRMSHNQSRICPSSMLFYALLIRDSFYRAAKQFLSRLLSSFCCLPMFRRWEMIVGLVATYCLPKLSEHNVLTNIMLFSLNRWLLLINNP